MRHPYDMNRPGWDWHPLKGGLSGHWSISLNGAVLKLEWVHRALKKEKPAQTALGEFGGLRHDLIALSLGDWADRAVALLHPDQTIARHRLKGARQVDRKSVV
jgi:hypothetical protein